MPDSIQQQVVTVAREAGEEFFRYVAAMPAERLEWQPLETGQTAIRMCREIAVTPLWALSAMGVLEGESQDWPALMETWKTPADCLAAFHTNLGRWAEYVLSMPEERLSETRWLPFNGGRDHTYLEMLEYPRWNATYHLGQVAYIQTLYGDRDIH
jgi:hypothetical protein